MLGRVQAGVEEQHRFVADASHELRTPLAVMRTELGVSLRSPTLDDAAREVLASTREEVARVSAIVDGLLMLASMDEGSLSLASEPVVLADVADHAISGLAPLARANGVIVSRTGADATVTGDRARLDQVVTNLNANALAFAPRGSAVDVQTWERGGEAGMSVIATRSRRRPVTAPTDLRSVRTRGWREERRRWGWSRARHLPRTRHRARWPDLGGLTHG